MHSVSSMTHLDTAVLVQENHSLLKAPIIFLARGGRNMMYPRSIVGDNH